MALDKTSLKNRIINELQAQGFNINGKGRDNVNWIDKFAQAIANAVIDEIQQNAETSVDKEKIL
ncbi:hypothetical protein SAMN06265182_0970 [Persephonella hydrogeniphila]|uniref:Uncharacterized protein n=1 Tax=Persephonella hydrogeniphila TaxID=198703 RepID=A0A285NFM2_9AQUI|nr:hypothetical protein [Persephonella hydrogeniphila]SNZ07693.1 hypothetical protein SAMN06265182_0970 [Persephonella hydrogeniphila]